jgi:uncharacterized protein YdeI (YjbR/CyaY-like superfamily)
MGIASTDFRHTTPDELRSVLDADEALNAKWRDLTPLARNEWICWLTSPKKQETRSAHLVRLQEDILDGKRRPCCWPGCPHRRESARKWFKD